MTSLSTNGSAAERADVWTPPSAKERWAIIRGTKSVAMVGASPNPARPSYFVATYLLSSSCSFEHLWFVHPTADEILGRPLPAQVDVSMAALRSKQGDRLSDQVGDRARRLAALAGAAKIEKALQVHFH